MRNTNIAYLLHALFSFFLFLEQFALTRHVASITFCQHVFSNLLHRLSCHDFTSYRCLDGNVKLLAREKVLQAFAHSASQSDSIVNILFLDEISAAPQSVQAAAYQITLDRAVGEHKLPENCIVIAAGNRTTDKSVAFKMPKALANRLLHIEVEGSFNSWKQWAIQSGINEKVVGFLTFNRERLMNFDSNADDLAFATPRSWEMVSNILNYVDSDIDKVYSLIVGIIGSGSAIEFRTWSRVYKDLPDIEEIFDGKQPPMPTRTDAMYALCASMTAYAREHRDDMKRIANSIIYAQQMAPDFSTVLLKDYMYIEKDYRKKLLNIPEFSAWLNSKGKLLNGNI